MSNAGIFLIGALVTLMVAGALGLVIVGALLDGRAADSDTPARRRRPKEHDGALDHSAVAPREA